MDEGRKAVPMKMDPTRFTGPGIDAALAMLPNPPDPELELKIERRSWRYGRIVETSLSSASSPGRG